MYIRKLLLFCFFLIRFADVFPGEVLYPVSSIDPALLKNARIVVRSSETSIEIKSLNSEVVKKHYVITILKVGAEESAGFCAPYDNYSSVDALKGSLYDAFGKLIRHFNSKDITDQSAIMDGLLYTDDREKIIKPILTTFPVTVEYYCETSFRRILQYPSFLPYDDYDESVEYASLDITCKEGLFPRIKELRIPSNTVISGDGISSRHWEFRHLESIKQELLSPSFEELTPVIYIVPVAYKFKEYHGDFTTWQNIGLWSAILNAGRDTLSPEVTRQIRSMVETIPDRKEKIKKLYTYLQKSTRYVGVKLGIGGQQPEEAGKVASLGYGDCKGLVNYMAAMLKAAGIPSLYTLVRAGLAAEPVQKDFPRNVFNHIILCVPDDKDTIWLECTNQFIPFGFLGSFTDDRDVLLITREGGILKHTPVYGKEFNIQIRNADLTIDSSGQAFVDLKISYRGLQYESVDDMLLLPPEKQTERLLLRYTFPGIRILSFKCSVEGDMIPVAKESIRMSVRNFASISGNRVFVPFDRFIDPPGILKKDDDRVFDLVLHKTYCDIDTLRINLPVGYHIESIPASCMIKTNFGTLFSEVKEIDRQILVVRRFEREKGCFPASAYNDFVEFLRQVSKQDNKKLVIVH